MLETLMQKFADEMEMDKELFSTTTVGTYQVVIDGNTKLKIMETNPGFWMECLIAPCPSKNQEFFYTDALLGNLFGQGTYGATVGLSEDGVSVILTRHVTQDVTYKGFRNILEDFFNAIDFWREEIRSAEKGTLRV
jgi:hypothetical protein